MADTEFDGPDMARDQILYHDEGLPWQAPAEELCLLQIGGHLEAHLGAVEVVYHEIASDAVHVDVQCVAPTAEYPFVRLVTSGMSDLPMAVPAGCEAPMYAELMITLPGYWRLDMAGFEDECWYWPVRLLKMLARLPHKYNTWLGWGHTIPNGDPPEPYADNTGLCCAILLQPLTAPRGFGTLRINEKKTITFYSVVPLYESEMNLKLSGGTEALLELLDLCGVTETVDIQRVNVTACAT